MATAVPRFELTQSVVMARAASFLPTVDKSALERLMPVYGDAGIERSYSCAPREWYGTIWGRYSNCNSGPASDDSRKIHEGPS